ncbi:MAG: hypothetical protein JWM88_1404 [Verrucomicrobia bacterium]|nr:hypothetical protein [Verrucomicrobiota bacterium]
MKARGALAAALTALVVIVAWLLWSVPHHRSRVAAHNRLDSPLSPARPPASMVAKLPEPPEPRSELADQLNSPMGTILQDLAIVREVVDAYRSSFHENPVGTNAEITEALMGRNPLHLALIPPNHPAVNLRGELCDRWGRPFFFHQLSGTRMELRSSGPDRTMWNEDDVVLTP